MALPNPSFTMLAIGIQAGYAGARANPWAHLAEIILQFIDEIDLKSWSPTHRGKTMKQHQVLVFFWQFGASTSITTSTR